MTRIPEITEREQLPEKDRRVFDEIAAARGGVRGPFRLLLRTPGVAERMLNVLQHLRSPETQLEPRVAELTILCTATFHRCAYIWQAHVPPASAAGIDETTIGAVRDRRVLDLAPDDRLLYELLEQTIERRNVSSDAYGRAEAHFGATLIVEILTLSGFYTTLAYLLNAFEVEPA